MISPRMKTKMQKRKRKGGSRIRKRRTKVLMVQSAWRLCLDQDLPPYIYTWSVNHGVNNLSRSYRRRSASAVTGVGASPAKTDRQLSDSFECKFDRRLQVKCRLRNSAKGSSELSIGSIVANYWYYEEGLRTSVGYSIQSYLFEVWLIHETIVLQ